MDTEDLHMCQCGAMTRRPDICLLCELEQMKEEEEVTRIDLTRWLGLDWKKRLYHNSRSGLVKLVDPCPMNLGLTEGW